MKQEFGTLDNISVTICGDILNSRVAKSNIEALRKFGAKIYLSGPEVFLPNKNDLSENCSVLPIDEALKKCDVAMFLRIQHERHHDIQIDLKSYNQEFGLNKERELLMPEHAIIMHPGPFNRDIEITSDLIESPRSRIFKQKQNGVFIRMAILEWIVL